MEQIQALIMENPMVLVGVVGGIAVLVIIIRIVVAIAGGKRKKAALATGNMVVVEFDEAVFAASRTAVAGHGLSGYRIYAVNGGQPNIVGGNLLVPIGHVVLEFEYIISMAGRRSTGVNRWPEQRVEFDVQQGKRYSVEFDIMTGETTWKVL